MPTGEDSFDNINFRLSLYDEHRCNLPFVEYMDSLDYYADSIISEYSCNMSSREGWQDHFVNIARDNSTMLNTDQNSIRNMFKEPFSDRIMNKYELKYNFDQTVKRYMTTRWAHLDTKYTLPGILEHTKCEALYKGIVTTKASNSQLDLNWKELCRFYAISHHKLTPMDINDVKNFTPETFYTHMQTLDSDKKLCPTWKSVIE